MFTAIMMALTVMADLPMGTAPEPVAFPHFPDRMHAYVWRNWPLVPAERLAQVVGAKPEEIVALGKAMGLSDPPSISDDQQARSYVTIIRRNWHLLPYDQLAELLGWRIEQMDYALREGDGLFWWMGGYKPKLEPLRYVTPSDAANARAAEIAGVVRDGFPEGVNQVREPLFAFVEHLSTPSVETPQDQAESLFSPRFCFSYFGAFREPLSGSQDPYPAAYLDRLAASGVDGVWLHEPLYRLARFPWDDSLSEGLDERLETLRTLVARAHERGIGIYLYLNEPRPMPMAFFERYPELKGIDDTGVITGQVATLCTSVPAVQEYVREGVASLCRAVPGLAGIFTITASESFTNCWSHHHGELCPRCGPRGAEVVIAEINTSIADGIADSGSACRLIAWDWGWSNAWAEGIISRLPKSVALQSVSEWELPINRGGVASAIGEYSISAIGPGPRALRHWALAREHGLQTMAKIQAGTTWELGSVPYIPAVENVAQHVTNLRDAGVNGLMMSWTLGGYPSSPNLEAAHLAGRADKPTVDETLMAVASRRFGAAAAPAVVRAWKGYSAALREYPFAINVLYNSPVHLGPANLLWDAPTQYRGSVTMAFAYPFDDVDTWRGPYPAETFADQFALVAHGFRDTLNSLQQEIGTETTPELTKEMGVAEACAINFQSVSNQTRFVGLRNQLANETDPVKANALLDSIQALLRDEIELARRLHAIQSSDSRIGFEAACQYFYVSVDLGEKVLNCQDILARWLPAQRTALVSTN